MSVHYEPGRRKYVVRVARGRTAAHPPLRHGRGRRGVRDRPDEATGDGRAGGRGRPDCSGRWHLPVLDEGRDSLPLRPAVRRAALEPATDDGRRHQATQMETCRPASSCTTARHEDQVASPSLTTCPSRIDRDVRCRKPSGSAPPLDESHTDCSVAPLASVSAIGRPTT